MSERVLWLAIAETPDNGSREAIALTVLARDAEEAACVILEETGFGAEDFAVIRADRVARALGSALGPDGAEFISKEARYYGASRA